MSGTGTPMVGVRRGPRMLLQGVLIAIAVLWLLPMVAAFYASFRYFESDSNVNCVFSLPKTLTLDNFTRKIRIVELSGFLREITVTITYPANGQTKTYEVTALISQYA